MSPLENIFQSVDVETQILIAKDQALLSWLGEILSDEGLYNNNEYDWFGWCQEARRDTHARAQKLGQRGTLEAARSAIHDESTTAQIIKIDTEYITNTTWPWDLDEDEALAEAA